MTAARVSPGMMVAGVPVPAAPVNAGTWKLSTRVDYTNCDHVSTLYAPVNIKYRGVRSGPRLTVPQLEVSGPGTVLEESGPPVPGPIVAWEMSSCARRMTGESKFQVSIRS